MDKKSNPEVSAKLKQTSWKTNLDTIENEWINSTLNIAIVISITTVITNHIHAVYMAITSFIC